MGRHARDPSERLRASLWAFHVQRLAKGKTWEQLDALLDSGRTISRNDSGVFSVMRRIAFNGDPPEKIRCGTRGYFNLIVEVDRHFPEATATYHSPIWDLLRLSASPSSDVLRKFSQDALARLGIVQPSLAECTLAEELFGSESPFAIGSLDRIQAGASQLAIAGNLDALMVSAILARLAINRWAFDEAHIYADALRRCGRKHEDETVKGLTRGMLVALIGRRVVQNDWAPLHPGFWPRPRSILKGRSRTAHDENPGFLYEQDDDELGPFSVAATDVVSGVPLVTDAVARSTLSDIQRSWRDFLETIPQKRPGPPSREERRILDSSTGAFSDPASGSTRGPGAVTSSKSKTTLRSKRPRGSA